MLCAGFRTAGSNPALSVPSARHSASSLNSGTCSIFSILDCPIALKLPSNGESWLRFKSTISWAAGNLARRYQFLFNIVVILTILSWYNPVLFKACVEAIS